MWPVPNVEMFIVVATSSLKSWQALAVFQFHGESRLLWALLHHAWVLFWRRSGMLVRRENWKALVGLLAGKRPRGYNSRDADEDTKSSKTTNCIHPWILNMFGYLFVPHLMIVYKHSLHWKRKFHKVWFFIFSRQLP